MNRTNRSHILLVEDNEADAELTVRALENANLGYSVLHLQNGAEALDYLFATGPFASRSVSHTPRLILLDLKMPKVDGLEVLQRIKADERTKTIPVVVMTSSNEERDIVSSYKLGVNSYIVKPVSFQDFLKTVGELGLYWLFINQPPK